LTPHAIVARATTASDSPRLHMIMPALALLGTDDLSPRTPRTSPATAKGIPTPGTSRPTMATMPSAIEAVALRS